MNLQPLTLADIPAAMALQRAAISQLCMADYTAADCTAWANSITEADFTRIVQGNYYKQEQDGKLITIGGWEGDNLKLLYTQPEFVGQGHATAFFQALENQYLKTKSEEKTTALHVISTLTALPFYLRMGFVKVQEYLQPITATLSLPMWILTKKYEPESHGAHA